MPAGTDLIFFDDSDDWTTIVNTRRTARFVTENTHEPIAGFDLGVTLNDDYIAVVAGTTTGKPNWFFAGDITQVYNFAPGGGNPILGKIQPPRTRLAINRLQLVETNRISTDSFRLKYTPPAWFKDCTIRVYRYVGDKLNFVEDTLFAIGNELGIDPNQPEGLIQSQLTVIEELVTDKFIELNERIEQLESGTNQRVIDLLEEIKVCACGEDTSSQGLSTDEPDGKFFTIN